MSFLNRLARPAFRCGRCKVDITRGSDEICWWCRGILCFDCWDIFGHCGHEDAVVASYAISAAVDDLKAVVHTVDMLN